MVNWVEMAGLAFAFITLQGSLWGAIVKGMREFGKIDTRLAVLESKIESAVPSNRRRRLAKQRSK